MSESPQLGRDHRLCGFDNVRGLAALAVVALHASYAYALYPLPGLVWPVPLDEPSKIADVAFWWIEGSIMPLFFTLSGYFLARSLAWQSPRDVFSGRTRRLLVPMGTVGLAILVADFHVWTLGLITTGRAQLSHYRAMKFPAEIQADLFGPAHLWYVEYLWLLCTAVCLGAWFIRRLRLPHVDKIRSAFLALVAGALATSLIAILTFYPQVVLGFQHGWLPNPAKLAHSALFLGFGYVLHQSRGATEQIRKFGPLSLAVAAIAFVVLLPRIHEAMENGRAAEFNPLLGLLLAIFAVTATCGHLGAGLRWLDRPSPWLAQLAAASFWIYLTHHPLVGLFQVLLRPVPIPAIAKFGAILAATLAICLITYALWGERSLLRRLLHGEAPWRLFQQPAPSAAAVDVRKAA